MSNAQLDMTAICNPGGWEHKHHVYCQSQGECLRHKQNDVRLPLLLFSHEKILDFEAKMLSYYSGIRVGGSTFFNNMKLLQEN